MTRLLVLPLATRMVGNYCFGLSYVMYYAYYANYAKALHIVVLQRIV